MKAYFVHNQETQSDLFITSDNGQMIRADKDTMFQFISAQPDFSQWRGEPLDDRPPEALGVIVATRREDGDVCIVEESLWQERMTLIMGSP